MDSSCKSPYPVLHAVAYYWKQKELYLEMLKFATQRFARTAAPLTALLGLGGFLTGAAHAQTVFIPVYSTGQSTVYSAGTQTQYATSNVVTAVSDSPWTVNGATSLVTTPNSNWLANDGNSKWISNVYDSNGGIGGNSAPGAYTFQTSFVMPANVVLSTATISFKFVGDNSVTSVKVNGATASGITGTGFTAFSSGTLNSSNAVFTSGTNTLQFVVQNDNDGAATNPMGLRVQFTNATASLQPAAAPEPGSFALVALGGLPAIGIVARRRRKKA